jgi:hypothetical protein
LKFPTLISGPRIICILIFTDFDHAAALSIKQFLTIHIDSILRIFPRLILKFAATSGICLVIIFNGLGLCLLLFEASECRRRPELASSHASSNPRFCLDLPATLQLDLFFFIGTESDPILAKLLQDSSFLSFLVGQLWLDPSLAT